MSSFLCFICHNTVHDDTNGETREKYRELVGMKLCQDSHLCYICCHLLNKLWLFKSICLRRSMEYPILFSDKGIISLQNSNTETMIMCPKTDECDPHCTQIDPDDSTSSNNYVSLEDRINIHELKDIDARETEDNDGDYYDQFNDDNYESNENIQTDKVENDSPICDTPNINEALSLDINEDKSNVNEDISNLDKKKEFNKVILSTEEQRAELEAKRREDKYLEAEFKCYNCALGFLFKDTYQAHMMRHEESNGEHFCDICTLRFASAAVLRAHLCSHRERVTCLRCGRSVPPRRTAAHRARCGSGATRAPCHLCGNTFPDANGLQQHIKRFHLSKTSGKTYSCSVCGKRYTNQAAVRTHMIKHINRRFPCGACAATCRSPYALAQHRRARHPPAPAPAPAPAHACVACARAYSSRKGLLAHLRNSLAHQQTVFACPICARACPHRRALAAHMQAAHAAVKQHACAACPARYTSRKSLAAHARAHAARAPPRAVCHLCGASFKGNNKLNRHLRSVCEKEKLEEELAAFYNQE